MPSGPRLRQKRNSRGLISLDPASVERFKKDLEHLQQAARREIVENALRAGGGVLHDAAETKAPGPHIEIEIMTGNELMRGWKSAAAQGIKSTDLYAVVGPDKDHWYYRFTEYGTKAHGVKKRKRTRFQQFSRSQGVSRKNIKTFNAAGKGRKAGYLKPAMVFEINGKLIFARKVRGKAARPFMRPAIDSKGQAAMREVGQVIGDEIEKVARR